MMQSRFKTALAILTLAMSASRVALADSRMPENITKLMMQYEKAGGIPHQGYLGATGASDDENTEKDHSKARASTQFDGVT